MDVARFQAGEPEALAAAVEGALPALWSAVEQGFTTTEAEVELLALGAASATETARRVAQVLGEVLTPQRRAVTRSDAELLTAALHAGRSAVLEAARAGGRVVSIATPEARAAVPSHVRNIERVLAGAERFDAAAPADVSALERLARGRAAAAGVVAALDDTARRLAQLRFVEGRSVAEVAEQLGKGRAFVRGHERRLRRRVRRALRAAAPGDPSGDAEVELALAGAGTPAGPPIVTRERVCQQVLTRVFPTEPRPYGERLAWALGAAGLGLALLALALLFAPAR